MGSGDSISAVATAQPCDANDFADVQGARIRCVVGWSNAGRTKLWHNAAGYSAANNSHMTMLKFELSEQMVMAMVSVLRTGPYNVVAPILNELQRQANAQPPLPAGSAAAGNGRAAELPHE